MPIPDNEGKACDAAVRILEKRTGETRTDIRRPEADGLGPPVDLRLRLGAQKYAIEHTRIEPSEYYYSTRRLFKEIDGYIQPRLADALPPQAYFVLHVPMKALPSRRKRKRALNSLVDWIRTNVSSLYESDLARPEPHYIPIWPNAGIQDKPSGFNLPIELRHWPNASHIRREPGYLQLQFDHPDLEALRKRRLTQAFSDKCPKLHECKEEGARTVLVLESAEFPHNSLQTIGNELPKLLAEHTCVPDEIYLLVTQMSRWGLCLVKSDNDHWPSVGMPKGTQIAYGLNQLPTAGLPKWYRDAFQLDALYAPYLSQWAPVSFAEQELDDMTLGRDTK